MPDSPDSPMPRIWVDTGGDGDEWAGVLAVSTADGRLVIALPRAGSPPEYGAGALIVATGSGGGLGVGEVVYVYPPGTWAGVVNAAARYATKTIMLGRRGRRPHGEDADTVTVDRQDLQTVVGGSATASDALNRVQAQLDALSMNPPAKSTLQAYAEAAARGQARADARVQAAATGGLDAALAPVGGVGAVAAEVCAAGPPPDDDAEIPMAPPESTP